MTVALEQKDNVALANQSLRKREKIDGQLLQDVAKVDSLTRGDSGTYGKVILGVMIKSSFFIGHRGRPPNDVVCQPTNTAQIEESATVLVLEHDLRRHDRSKAKASQDVAEVGRLQIPV